ncbi:MAG: branched-chain amino acid transport system permease protein, partial [Actinomycetota bacterium]|nr:branched-chain amino acid transport system permease protein [Actinomycetota bacterium]
MIKIPNIPQAFVTRHGSKAVPLGLAGAVLLIIGSLLAWSFDPAILQDLSISFSPAGLQLMAIAQAVLALLLLLGHKGPLAAFGEWADTALGLRALATWTLIFMTMTIVAIAVEAGGLVNIEPGAWVSFLGAVLLFASSRLVLPRETHNLAKAILPSWAEILVIVIIMAALLFGTAYALGLEDAWEFVLFLVFVGTIVVAAARSGLVTWLGYVTNRHKRILILSAFVVAFSFPLTQGGSDANMSIAAQVLVFAAAAMGLNIVVGLAGLLDLGYIAFLGAGAYVGATLSTSGFATIGWKPPFIVVILVAGCFSALLGLIIGTPTLRVSGDYLAIVTLGFGEIFRLTMFNLDGNNGPDLTHGPNGVPAIPDLEFGGFNFGDTHELLGIPLARFSNYYFLLLVLIGFIILVFHR